MRTSARMKTFVLLLICTLCATILSSCGQNKFDSAPEDYVQAQLKAATGKDITQKDLFKGIINDGWVYYTNYADSQKLTKIKLDGSGKTTINPDNRCQTIGVQDGWIYFTDAGNSFSGIYKIKTDGTGKTKIIGGTQDHEAMGFYVKDDWIYYIDDGVNDYSIFKVKLDGSNSTRLNKGTHHRIIPKDDYIYYINSADQYVYRMKLDGTENTVLYNQPSEDFQICGNYIYVMKALHNQLDGIQEGDGNLFRINLDGSDSQLIKKAVLVNFSIYDDWLCYNQINKKDGSKEMAAEKLDGSNKTSFGDKGTLTDLINIGNYLYYKGAGKAGHDYLRVKYR